MKKQTEINPKTYAQTLLDITRNRPSGFSFQVPIDKLRVLCNYILNYDQDIKLPPMTDVERSVLTAVKADIAQGIQPTIRSVAARLEYKTPSSAQVVIDRLIKFGVLARNKRKQIIVVNTRK